MQEVLIPLVRIAKGGVRFSGDELAEVDSRGHPVLRIPRPRIRQLGLRWGYQAARPLVQLVLGIVFTFGGGGLGIPLVLGVVHGAAFSFRLAIGLITMAIVGSWLLWTAPARFLPRSTDGFPRREDMLRPAAQPGRGRSLPGRGEERLGHQILGG